MNRLLSKRFWWILGSAAYLVVLLSVFVRVLSFVREERTLRESPIEQANLVIQLQQDDLQRISTWILRSPPPPPSPTPSPSTPQPTP